MMTLIAELFFACMAGIMASAILMDFAGY